MTTTIKTRVGIVGAGPSGLMLSNLLAKSGIDSVAIDTRPRAEIETTHRAGILEDGVVKTLVESGVSDRVHTDGYEHHGIELRFDRAGHRIDFGALVNASCWLYPQTDVFIDLANARDRDCGDVRFGVRDSHVSAVAPPLRTPWINGGLGTLVRRGRRALLGCALNRCRSARRSAASRGNLCSRARRHRW
jgi:p-hydroxybenzoate 3-monooxygenase